MRIVADDCPQLKPQHDNVQFLTVKAKRHDLLLALTDKLATDLYAVEDAAKVAAMAKDVIRGMKRDFEISDLRRLLHSPDRFFTPNALQANSVQSVVDKLRVYKARNPNILQPQPQSHPAVHPTDECTSELRKYDACVVLEKQRPLWQTLQWL